MSRWSLPAARDGATIEPPRRWLRRWAWAVAAIALLASPAIGFAQTCTDCTLYAVAELNLRQNPSLEAAVLRFVPAGAAVYRTAGAEANGYAPVTFDSVPGWVVALGLASSLEEIDAAPSPASDDQRVTLSALNLRSEPAMDAPTILIMPEGAIVTLTREGAANGYVTIDYDGTGGWAFADLLGEPAA